jgi:ABC-type glycerol-3-phosphate transport system permease component
MGIIGKVGRKSFKVKALNTSIHFVLFIGGITMIYPFLIMMSASFKSRVDSNRLDLIPKYFYNEEVLFRKYVEARFNEEAAVFSAQYKQKYYAVDYLEMPREVTGEFIADWNEFIKENEHKYDEFDFAVSEQFSRGVYTFNERAFRDKMSDEVNGNLSEFNDKYSVSAPTWEDVREESKEILSRRFTSGETGLSVPYDKFRKELDLKHKVWLSPDGHFIANELVPAYRGKLESLNDSLGTNYASWENIILNKNLPDDPLSGHWSRYVKNILNVKHILLSEHGMDKFRSFLTEKYSDISLLNETWKSRFENFSDIDINQAKKNGAPLLDYIFFIENKAEPAELILNSVEFDFRDFAERKYGNIDSLNRSYGRGYENFSKIELFVTSPDYNAGIKKDRSGFIRKIDPVHIEISPSAQFEFIEYLKHDFSSGEQLDPDKVNSKFGTDFDAELNIYPSKTLPENPFYAELWTDFALNHADPKFILLKPELENEWREYLKNKYGAIENLNSAWGLLFSDFRSIGIDHAALDYDIFREHKSKIFKEMLTRNYIMVIDEMYSNGRAIMNTLIYCLLAILTAVIVNPLAAYAMSRFKLRSNYKIILVLMLTMAFPPMVMGIPNFLMLKNFNMLNTFWALILPGAADGYFIFLLKGFFDSLPKELFESATVDGAGEVTIFTRIAMSLSKPIMAVIALGAFNAAYRNFMFAFIVCQDQSMWTMMVHIYQLMQRSSAGVGYAALVIAAIPTFAVFIFFQNIIIKGIVVPTEK